MKHIKANQAEHHEYFDGVVKVNEFNFDDMDGLINDADITLTGRYPESGYTMNTVSTVVVRVQEGEGELVIKNGDSAHLNPGDRVTIKPGEPYYFTVIGKLALNYIATPAWTPGQTTPVKE
jgi:hypothetical protein